MSVQLLLIDAMNLIRRIYAVQERPFQPVDNLSDATARQLLHNTIKECESALLKLLAEHAPSHALAVFDSHQPGWRHKLFAGYKQGRSPMPETLAKGLDQIQQCFWQHGVDSLLSDQDEADDLIATLAAKVADKNGMVTVVSTDKGFCQLLSGRIKIWDHFKKQWVTGHQVHAKFGVIPQQLTEYWALAGDSTNKIPGLEGIGPKTASQILSDHRTYRQALSTDALSKSVSKKLHQFQDDFALYQQLSTLKTDIPLGFNLQDIRFPRKEHD